MRILDRRRKKLDESLAIYNTRMWRKCRENVLIKYMGLDVWLLGIGIVKRIDGRIYVHHIEERNESPGKIFELDNLITVSYDSHEEIHAMYDKDKPAALARIQRGIAKFYELYPG